MRILLDTNAFIWQAGLGVNDYLGQKTRTAIEDSDEVFVSSISLVELHIKSMLGKFQTPKNLMAIVVGVGDQNLDFSSRAADQLRSISGLVRHDPFDRMLLAQAQAEKLLFYTADQIIIKMKLGFVRDARK